MDNVKESRILSFVMSPLNTPEDMKKNQRQSLIRPEAYPESRKAQPVKLLPPLAILLALIAGILLVSGGADHWYAIALFIPSIGLGARQIGFPKLELVFNEELYDEIITDLTMR